jgi:hypothetical protein
MFEKRYTFDGGSSEEHPDLKKKKAAVRSNTWERISMVVVRLILISLRNFCEEIAKK